MWNMRNKIWEQVSTFRKQLWLTKYSSFCSDKFNNLIAKLSDKNGKRCRHRARFEAGARLSSTILKIKFRPKVKVLARLYRQKWSRTPESTQVLRIRWRIRVRLLLQPCRKLAGIILARHFSSKHSHCSRLCSYSNSRSGHVFLFRPRALRRFAELVLFLPSVVLLFVQNAGWDGWETGKKDSEQ